MIEGREAMSASPTQDQVTVGEVVFDALRRLVAGNLSVEEMDKMYAAVRAAADRIENTPVYLLRAALDEAEGDGLWSQGAMFAAQAIDNANPDFGGAIEAALEEVSERLNEKSRTPDGTPRPF
jgi:hypothetical protein